VTVPSFDEIRGDVMSLFSPSVSPRRPGAVGVELEVIPIDHTPAGEPSVPPIEPTDDDGLSLTGFLSAYGEATERIAADWDERGTPRYRTCRGGLLQFEPGGQIEFSTAVRNTAAEAIADTDVVLGDLTDAGHADGLELLSCGLNPRFGIEQVGLQLRTPRYMAMDRYFARVGPGGRRMMRLTASMQVNLDLGDPSQARRRWAAANLLAPLCTAMFANSPARVGEEEFVSGRAWVWETTDPSRTGIAWKPEATAGEAEPWTEYCRFALESDIMLQLDASGGVVDAPPGVPFREWWEGRHGPPPTTEEWRMHLTTLFPEVRPRGWLELRSIDAPARKWWGVPPTLLAAILYDDQAVSETLEALATVGQDLPRVLQAAPRAGLRDRLLGAASRDVIDIAMRAAPRFPGGFFDSASLDACAAFCDRYVARSRMQADDRPATEWTA